MLSGGCWGTEEEKHVGVRGLWKGAGQADRWLHSTLFWYSEFSGHSVGQTEKDTRVIPSSPAWTDAAPSWYQGSILHRAEAHMCCLIPWCIPMWKKCFRGFQKRSGENSLNSALGISQKRGLGNAGEELLYFSLFIFCDTEPSSFCREAAQPNPLQ